MKASHRDCLHYNGTLYLKPVQKLVPILGGEKQPREVVISSSESITAVVILGSSVRTWLVQGL